MAQKVDTKGEQHPFSDPEENRVLFAALDSFRQYRKTAHYNVTHRRRQNFYALPTSQWQILAAPPFSLLDTLEEIDEAIDANADLANEIVDVALASFGIEPSSTFWHNTAKASDLDKARLTLRQLYRDWSSEGAVERNASYGPILTALKENFADNLDPDDRGRVKVLVPGAGLGRLVYEICEKGYCAEGNEISWHQLMVSNWVLNHISPASAHDLYPFALDFSNVFRRQQQLMRVRIPDVHVASVLHEVGDNSRMSMTASDFILLYGNEEHKDTFHAVASAFFVDTAPNAFRYIETIRNCLKDGGIWINLGPLLWHFADRAPSEVDGNANPGQLKEKTGIEAPGSFELTDEELILLVQRLGFEVEKHEITDCQGYIQNPNSMLQNTYRCSHWIARKKPDA